MLSHKHIASFALLGALVLPASAGAAEVQRRDSRIESIDDQRTTIVVNDIAYVLSPDLIVRGADGKPVSRSALRKGVLFEATPTRDPGKGHFVIKEIQLLDE